MHLKSLTLRGFKSFADRSVLSLEPGITAVVGPNGSGKSNISDAVLWVLGERNARNLRGQAMEDVIFSGSSGRKPVSLAEVELVLDNSDGTLPIDYREVSIARRLYRSGESEYLVNGSVARRMDVLDILHDTGLGTGTHSIISQGALDSILQSRPEDRRSLIEEAAGVLKHKQRKERSARKLEQMAAHLDRVRDVHGEVLRQLGPLERKARRAREHAAASERLDEVRLQLAVDHLRTLQGQWDRLVHDEQQADRVLDARRGAVAASERASADLQRMIDRASEGAGELSRAQRRAASASERLDSVEMLVRERARSALAYEADVRIALASAAERRQATAESLAEAQAALAEAQAARDAAQAQLDELAAAREQAVARRRDMERRIEQAQVSVRRAEREREELRRRRASMGDSLSNELAREQVIEARSTEVDSDVGAARDEAAAAAERLRALQADVEAAEAREREERTALAAAQRTRDELRRARDEADGAARAAAARESALESLQREGRADCPALTWLVDESERFGGLVTPLSKVIGAPKGLEWLVEALLGDDLAGLAVPARADARAISQALIEAARAGSVSLVAGGAAAEDRAVPARRSGAGVPLIDRLSCADGAREAVEALLGDVVLVDDVAAAFQAAEDENLGLRYVSRDGCAVRSTGVVRVFGAARDEADGLLARERRLEEQRAEAARARAEAQRAHDAAATAEEECRALQARSLDTTQSLARLRGEVASLRTEAERAERKVAAFVRERDQIARELDTARRKVGDLRPAVEQLDERLAESDRLIAASTAEHEQLAAQVAPLRREAGALNERHANAKLSLATLTERSLYAQRMREARERDAESLQAELRRSLDTLALKRAVQRRCEPLLDVLDRLSAGLARRARVLDDAIAAREESHAGMHARAAAAREDVARARSAFDEANARMTQVRIDKGRLEVQVEAAVDAIVRDCGTPLDRVEGMARVEDRAALEDEMFRLERRIKNMGAVNPDAAREFTELKARADFLQGQLDDMEAARCALDRISKIIDVRMKNHFISTFEQVNAGFSHIFEVLFPGGSARLELVDPDNVDTTGIEVVAQPRGKRITKMMLMSGGEKSLTALALLFAVYRIRATPFYILDEVEAALDDTNLRRLAAYLDSLRESTQLIMITHQRRTMEMADVLFGVSMQGDGVTRVISQKLDQALRERG
ncbi:chromosome segregation protein SMC [Eggerthellaceae bacterium zg-1084]|uniref:chromosome segregation protein SMC n=1 Tax=Berryella wangjianweii TaxID=2734634 RepID=UPI001552E03B|nr:chromosome segregation protein SMC [Berryella wangjianweii]NPD31248.1 chromosome segregation protein SMC [Berryella wangjianweii]